MNWSIMGIRVTKSVPARCYRRKEMATVTWDEVQPEDCHKLLLHWPATFEWFGPGK